jgi:hypothetical protein
MNEAFDEQAAARVVAGSALQVDLENVVRRDQGRRQRPRHEKAVGRGRVPDRDVPEGIEHALGRENAAPDGQIVQKPWVELPSRSTAPAIGIGRTGHGAMPERAA